MRAEKENLVVGQCCSMELGHHVDNVQRQPADGEDNHHGDQHAIRAFLAADFDLFAYARSAWQGATCQCDPHLVVAERDD